MVAEVTRNKKPSRNHSLRERRLQCRRCGRNGLNGNFGFGIENPTKKQTSKPDEETSHCDFSVVEKPGQERCPAQNGRCPPKPEESPIPEFGIDSFHELHKAQCGQKYKHGNFFVFNKPVTNEDNEHQK